MTWRHLALVVLALFPFAVSAQETPTPDPGDGTITASVDYGDYTLEIDADQPLVACVVERNETLDGTTSTAVVFVRNLDGSRSPLGTFLSDATAALKDASVGECLSLAGR